MVCQSGRDFAHNCYRLQGCPQHLSNSSVSEALDCKPCKLPSPAHLCRAGEDEGEGASGGTNRAQG